ncbi:MAG TPA: FAD-dependent oxidoreductase [Solirubrobacteraceae bacterium]|jgi:ferredoxin--NADP+ reductase|nr:FAD-dependent oxidoreductase [Solirubrobacteraceae bacterium]
MSIRVAIVGAGPAGFYAADRLLRSDQDVRVELLDRLPTPWGLVRAGVAPDHPNIKAVTRVYEKTAALEGFHFHGNVEVGTQLTHADLVEHHHAVIYANGASRDRQLGIEGEDLPGVVGATDFVSWYNGHPDAAERQFDLSGKRAVVVGNGNVALDVARMLVLPRDELAVTDTADYAIEAIANAGIEEVVVLGRRGPAQAAFTTPELRELGELTQADVIVDPDEASLDPGSEGWLENAHATNKKNVQVIQEYAQRSPEGKPKRVVLRFLRSPLEIHGDANGVTEIVVARNELKAADDGSMRATQTDDTETISCELVLRSIGYRGTAIDGVPFAGHIATVAHEGGRVIEPDGTQLPGVYATGWIKRGPTGVIGTNKKCAYETVDHLLEDAAEGKLPEPAKGADDFERLLDELDAVDYEGWGRIDAYERARGEAQGRPRVKITSAAELLERSRRSG